MRPLELALAALFLLAPVSSIAKEESAKIYGEGNISCGHWTEIRKNNSVSAMAAAAWVRGYISAGEGFAWAFNLDTAPVTDSDAMMAWIDTYCAAHPLDPLVKATLALREALIARKHPKQ